MSTDFSDVWLKLLSDIIAVGRDVSPRGKLTRELPQRTIIVEMERPVLTVAARALNYKFMAAEAYWILTGDNRVETIAPYNKRIADFSDDGQVFFGAYGPKVIEQLPYVVSTLAKDPDSRQAGLTLWRESPAATKDVPCTVAMFFGIRNGRLNNHVFMRSSDAWLGIPYDVCNFSMVAHLVCSLINEQVKTADVQRIVTPGALYLTAASSHLYEPNWEQATACIEAGSSKQHPTPNFWAHPPKFLIDTLRDLRESKPGDALRWWEHK